MPSDRMYYDSNGNPIDPRDLKARVKQNYDQYTSEPIFNTNMLPKPSPPVTNEPPSYDPRQIEQHNELGNALMKQAAMKEQEEMQKRADQDKMRQEQALNNYNRILGNEYNPQPIKPGQVSDEEASMLASEFNKKPSRFKSLKKTMGGNK